MKKQDAMQEIETIRARLTVLEKIVQEEEKPQGLWRPEVGEHYCMIVDGHKPKMTTNDGTSCDIGVIEYAEAYKTEDMARKAIPLNARAHKIIQAALMADPDAGLYSDNRQWTLWCDSGMWMAAEYRINTEMPAYIHTQAQAEHMAAILNAEGV